MKQLAAEVAAIQQQTLRKRRHNPQQLSSARSKRSKQSATGILSVGLGDGVFRLKQAQVETALMGMQMKGKIGPMVASI